MTRFFRPALAIAAAAMLAAGPTAATTGGSMKLGVTTHFSQGWPLSLLPKVREAGVTAIRDSLHWQAVETQPGRYAFTPANSRHIDEACRAGYQVLLGIEPRNRLYDQGRTVFSPAARAAFARYISAIADRYPGCVTAIEIGNEINGRNGMTGPAAADRPAAYTAILKAVYEKVKPGHPGVAILGGSTNVIATGFLARLFDAGMLDYADGVVVHPYRPQPEGVDWELARLQAAMARAGKPRPIWATEFSKAFDQPSEAPSYALKMLTLMSASGVSAAYWYALIDQKWFPTMGLLTSASAEKPAGRAFAYAAEFLNARGRAVRLDPGDPVLFHYRFGQNMHVIWGGRRPLHVEGNAVFRDASGAIIARPAEISDAPIVIEGATAIRLGAPDVLADSRSGFGEAPWSYYATRGQERPIELRPVDWDWTSYMGTPEIGQLAATQNGFAIPGNTRFPIRAALRFTSPFTAPAATLSLCLANAAKAEGVSAEILHNGKAIWQGKAGPRQIYDIPVRLAPRDTIDLVLGPAAQPGLASVKYHLRVLAGGQDRATCQ